MTTTAIHSIRRLLILACILAVYILNVERWHSAVFFGQFQDDSIYFSTAKALANGEGYTLVSFPGSPPQTKYPIVYPWLLSRIWKFHPIFPDNLKLAIHLTEFFGCWSLIAGFFLARKLSGIGESAALMLTAVCAFQPVFVRMSGLVMSEMPFMACMLTVLAICVSTTYLRISVWAYLLLGVLAGVSVEIRTIGVSLVAGVCCVLLHRKSFRLAVGFAGGAVLAVLLVVISAILHRQATAGLVDSGEPGWVQVAAYYTDYVRFQWSMGVPSFGALFKLILWNLFVWVFSAGPVLIGSLGKLGSAAAVVFSIPIWIGLLRHTRHPEWRPAIFTFVFYSCIVLVWPYPQPERFLLPFIPVLLCALYSEMHRLGAMLITKIKTSPAIGARALAGVLTCFLAGLFGQAAWSCLVRDPHQLQIAAIAQARALEQREQAYQWIREHAGPNDRVAAWKDAVLYLYTGRQSLRPIAILPQAFYVDDQKSEQRDLAHMCDAPRHAGVRYWMTTSDDFNLEAHRDRVVARMAEISGVLPVVFQSSDGYAQIHDASCLNEQERPECRAIAPILFPK